MSWKPQDYVAIIFSLCIAVSLVMGAFSIAIMETTITEERKTLLGVVLTGVMSVIIMYMQSKKDEDD